jgi:hypothetical protein
MTMRHQFPGPLTPPYASRAAAVEPELSRFPGAKSGNGERSVAGPAVDRSIHFRIGSDRDLFPSLFYLWADPRGVGKQRDMPRLVPIVPISGRSLNG